jgi:arylsulfatase A-like enzyme
MASTCRSRRLRNLSACDSTRRPLAVAVKRSMAMVLLVTAFASASEDRPPNLIVIFADDLGYQDLGCFGSTAIDTPHIDRMATEGMKFTSFYAQPICGPSRAAIMTGCYPMRVAERDNIKNTHPVLHEREVTLAEVLKEKGYATGCFGKWDLARHSQAKFEPNLMPNHQGFDYFFGTPTSNDSVVNLYRNDKLIEPRTKMATLTGRYTNEVLKFIEKHKSQPFFIYLPHTMPHTRLAASEEFLGKSKRGLYGDVVEEIDAGVGRILSLLEKEQLANNTYVLFTSDNGPWLIKNQDKTDGFRSNDHGGSAGPLRSGKVSTWEGGVRVPTVFWAPGRIAPGTVCHEVASTLDVLPTFAALADAKSPEDRVIDGQDIQHLLAGRFAEADPEKTYYYYLKTHLQAVRQGKWKLHLQRPYQQPWLKWKTPNQHIAPEDHLATAQPMLFDLDADLGETADVAADHPDIVAQLLQLAEAAREDIGDYDRIGKNQRFFDDGPRRPDLWKK